MARPTPADMNLFKRLTEDLRLLVLLIRDYGKGRYRNVSPVSGIIFFLAVAYLLFPIDLIGDFIPGLGQLDDAAVLMGCLYFLEKDLYRYRDWRDQFLGNAKPLD
ncbi:YkvA family protein [Desulfosarcina sp.]|uniref:YkvA family protein n=1 Tax=Desulfosarcina sp. TaxID=2027861 RepID=UPI003970C093